MTQCSHDVQSESLSSDENKVVSELDLIPTTLNKTIRFPGQIPAEPCSHGLAQSDPFLRVDHVCRLSSSAVQYLNQGGCVGSCLADVSQSSPSHLANSEGRALIPYSMKVGCCGKLVRKTSLCFGCADDRPDSLRWYQVIGADASRGKGPFALNAAGKCS